jgi:mono/diheme cytochrome c family protein
VVRTASCPVLTVREPRLKEREQPVVVHQAGAVAALILAAGLMLFPFAVPPAAAQDAVTPQPAMTQQVPGSELYRTYCATCHGTAARGDGPLASSMTRKPADLTEIAKRNGGLFPSELVFRTIDGKRPVRGHGGADMPVWGDAFARSRDGGDPATVKRMIDSLVDYLESIQLRPAHQ